VRPTLEAYVRRFGEAAPVEGISGLKAAGDTVTLTLLRPCEGALAALCIPVAGTAGAWTALEQDAQHMLLENAAGERLELRVSSDPAAGLLAGTVTEARLETPDQSLLTALEEAGFVERRGCTQDKRKIRLYPTEKTLSLRHEILDVMDSWQAHLLQDLTPEDQQTLLSLLEKIRNRAMEERED